MKYLKRFLLLIVGMFIFACILYLTVIYLYAYHPEAIDQYPKLEEKGECLK